MAFSPLSGCERIRRARARRVRATKSPARCPARASRRSSGEYAFLEDSRYASQAKNATQEKYDASPVTWQPQRAGSIERPAASDFDFRAEPVRNANSVATRPHAEANISHTPATARLSVTWIR